MEELYGANSKNNIASTNEDQSFGSDEVGVLSHLIEAPSTSNIQDEVEISSQHSEIPLTSSPGRPDNRYIISGHRKLVSILSRTKHRGFSVIKRTTRKTAHGENKYFTQKTTKIVDCPARVNAIKQCDGSWMVSTLEANDIAGIKPCKSIRLAEVQSGGPMNLWCLPKDCRNFIEGRRKLRLGTGDAEAIRKLFWGLQKQDTDFICSLDIDDHGRLCNMLWIHSRCRAAYANFNDVLTFDTTYLVNKYKMPFATVVGINHHGQSILLGCALVTNDDAKSFKWFFKHWHEAMDDVHTKCIITVQCESIKIAIRVLMLNTIHRYCLWHIMSKVPQKFKGVAEYNNVVRDFKRIVYESITSETFELNWVPCYLNHVFWAEMLSTQRNEGMHAFFNGYIHSRSNLKQFVEQYELSMANKIQKEFIADHESNNKLIRCLSQFPWERQFRSAYTNNLFKKSRVNEFYTRDYTFTVDYTAHGEYFSCNCKKIKFMGLLCFHILAVLSKKDVQSVNERYLLRRWRKDIYKRHSSIFFARGYPHMPEEFKKFQDVEREMDFLKQPMYEVNDELLQFDQPPIGESTSASARTNGVDSIGGTSILNLEVTRARGRPRHNRFISASEVNRGRRATRGRGNLGRGRGNSGRGQNNPIPTIPDGQNFEFDLNDTVIGTQGSAS
ncbi:hypothetical protein ACP275_01G112600 [Erythranthe tilingii]